MEQINYMKLGMWTHCLRCHKNVHKDDNIQHFYTSCPNKDVEAKYPCDCIMPEFDFVPDKEGLQW